MQHDSHVRIWRAHHLLRAQLIASQAELDWKAGKIPWHQYAWAMAARRKAKKQLTVG